MIQDRAIVTLERICDLSNVRGIFNDLSDLDLDQISKSRYYSTSNDSKMAQDRLQVGLLQWQTLAQISRSRHYLFDAECLRNGTICYFRP